MSESDETSEPCEIAGAGFGVAGTAVADLRDFFIGVAGEVGWDLLAGATESDADRARVEVTILNSGRKRVAARSSF